MELLTEWAFRLHNEKMSLGDKIPPSYFGIYDVTEVTFSSVTKVSFSFHTSLVKGDRFVRE
jgi:hypothetical protein